MIQIIDKSKCCGCTACASICTHDAISMQPDILGFPYPIVDSNKCIDCGLCEKVCSFNDHYDISQNLPQPLVYAVRHKNTHEIETSRSGGAFIAISDYILENGGVIYGAGYTDHFRVIHKRATTKEERNEFKGSKYVQSDMNTVFRQVKKDLNAGVTVLFSGTPCQTSGLKSYIGKRLCEQLILVDIICHGVPSPYIWRDYLNYIEKKYNKKIVEVNFRDKSRIGWSGHIESFRFNDGEKKEFHIYTDLFYKHIILRPSCKKCFYANTQRPSDFTIGDFWGWEKTNAEFNKDNKGCSLLFCNTQKAELIFEQIKNNIYYIPSKIELCLQKNLQHPTIFHPKWITVESTYKNKNFTQLLIKYNIIGWKHDLMYSIDKTIKEIKRIIRVYIKRPLQKLIK